jgi:hypothetical protein
MKWLKSVALHLHEGRFIPLRGTAGRSGSHPSTRLYNLLMLVRFIVPLCGRLRGSWCPYGSRRLSCCASSPCRGRSGARLRSRHRRSGTSNRRLARSGMTLVLSTDGGGPGPDEHSSSTSKRMDCPQRASWIPPPSAAYFLPRLQLPLLQPGRAEPWMPKTGRPPRHRTAPALLTAPLRKRSSFIA